MRINIAIALIVLPLPIAICGQTQTTAGTGHFEGWLSDAHWGADKQTFDVRLGTRRVEATFTVAKNGFGWHRTFTNVKETFNSWEAVTAWCAAPGALLFRTQQADPRLGVYELEPEVLATIVDGYFKRYAPQAEWSAPGWECTTAGLMGPNPTDLSRVRELLKAASSENL
jgi:hypothetical protein